MEIKPNNLKNSLEIPFLTEKVKLNKGEYTAGELVEFDYSTKTAKKLSSAEKIFGVIPEAITTNGEKEVFVYITGIFNKSSIVSGISEIDTVKEHARPLSIYFR